MKRKLIVIVGPTAVGKSALAVELARKYNGEIISADSRQVYTGLDIGTGKITKREMRNVPHHLLDVANPARRQFSVAESQKIGRAKMDEIFLRGKPPVIVGGTGLYIQALVNDVSFPKVPPNKELRKRLEKKTSAQLFDLLRKLDTRRAKTIDAHNPRRLVRAIEIAKALGRVPSHRNSPRTDIDPFLIGLSLPNDELKKRIVTRLTKRMSEGMAEEVLKLRKKGLSWKRMEELGLEYRYISRCLRGLLTEEEMLKKLQLEIWQYAKRQMVWFKRDLRISWFSPREVQKILEKVKFFLAS